MQLITLERAKEHLRVDGNDEDALITVYANAAERLVSEYANRNLYPTAEALASAVGSISTDVAGAYADFDTANAAAAAITNVGERDFARTSAIRQLDARIVNARRTQNGLVATDDVLAAVLLTLGHLYYNREDVTTANAKEIPINAQFIMNNHRMLSA